MSRDVVHVRNTARRIAVAKTNSDFQGIVDKTGPVLPRLEGEIVTTTATGTSLVLGTGTLYNNVYISATWTASVDTNVKGYSVVFARAGVSTVQRVNGTSAWFEPAVGGESYTVTISNIYLDGRIGALTESDTIVAANDTTLPGTVTGLSLGTGLRSITVSWDENSDPDMEFGLGQYRVQLASDAGFSTILSDKKVGALVTSFTDLATDTQYWVRIKGVDTSGNESSSWSSSVTGTTGKVQGTDIADLAVTNLNVANATIESAKIVNLDVNKLTAGTGFINSLTIAAGGSVESSNYDNVGPVYDGWRIDNNTAVFNNCTIRGTLSGAEGTFAGELSAATGSFAGTVSAGAVIAADISANNITGGTIDATVAITGPTIKTAASGSADRIELRASDHSIRWFDGANERFRILLSGSTAVLGNVTQALRVDIAGEQVNINTNAGDINLVTGSGNIVLNTPVATLRTVDIQHDGVTCLRSAWSSTYSDDVAVLRRRTNTGGTAFADLGFGVVGTYSSRSVLKEWTTDLDKAAAVSRIRALRPVDYAYTAAAAGELGSLRVHRGFVAEEVAAVDAALVNYGWVDKNDPTRAPQPPSLPELAAKGFPGDWESWASSEYPLASAVPTMWDNHALITDAVAALQDVFDRLDVLEGN